MKKWVREIVREVVQNVFEQINKNLQEESLVIQSNLKDEINSLRSELADLTKSINALLGLSAQNAEASAVNRLEALQARLDSTIGQVVQGSVNEDRDKRR